MYLAEVFVKNPLGRGAERRKNGKVFDEKIVGQIGGRLSRIPCEAPKKHEKTGFMPVFLFLIYEIAAQAVKKYRIAHRRKRRVPHRNQQTAETSNK